METINGFTVVAERNGPHDDDRVILAAIQHPDERYEYVTARCDFRDVGLEPKSWYWGHYFQEDFERAAFDFLNR